MYYISKNYKSIFNASGKPRIDFEFSLEKSGFKNLGFKQSSIPNSAIGAVKNFFGITWALLRLPFKSVLFTQYPVNKFRKYIVFVAKLKKCKVATLVHDVSFLRKRTDDKNTELDTICKYSDVIIVHNKVMLQWFLDQGVTKGLVSLELFDYVTEERPNQNDNIQEKQEYSVVYAGGGYGKNKNAFVYEVDTLGVENFHLKLYGRGFEEERRTIPKEESKVYYEGAFPATDIPFKIIGDFGLVWDGNSAYTCEGQFGEYLKFNNPHKTSLYLLGGLPLIIWNEAALAPFVKEHEIGITVSSLTDIDETLKNLSFEEYKSIKNNVIAFQKRVMNGEFGKEAIEKSLKLMALNEV